MAKVHDPGYGHEKNLNQKVKGHVDGADPGKQYETGVGDHHDGYGSNVDTGKQDKVIECEYESKHDHLDGHPDGQMGHLRSFSEEDIECGYKSLGKHDLSDAAQDYDSDGAGSGGEIGGTHEKSTYDEDDKL